MQAVMSPGLARSQCVPRCPPVSPHLTPPPVVSVARVSPTTTPVSQCHSVTVSHTNTVLLPHSMYEDLKMS